MTKDECSKVKEQAVKSLLEVMRIVGIDESFLMFRSHIKAMLLSQTPARLLLAQKTQLVFGVITPKKY